MYFFCKVFFIYKNIIASKNLICYNLFGDTMRDILKICFMIIIVITVYIYKDNISNFITDNIIYKGSNKILTYNEYYLDNDYLYVQNTDINTVTTKQEILNVFYSIINSGDDSFTFYCNYDNCLNEVKEIIDKQEVVANINNFVHPYNSFSTINIDVTASGKVTVKIKKVYNEKEIEYINNYIDSFILSNINDSMSNKEKIKIFHDYIVNNTIYDEDSKNKAYTAYDLITTGKSICGGYSDIISIYLNKLGITNYKVTSENHIWNLIKLDNDWYHLDATWDDPVASDGNQYLIHNFFLISSDELLKLDQVEHNFDKNVYIEAK